MLFFFKYRDKYTFSVNLYNLKLNLINECCYNANATQIPAYLMHNLMSKVTVKFIVIYPYTVHTWLNKMMSLMTFKALTGKNRDT